MTTILEVAACVAGIAAIAVVAKVVAARRSPAPKLSFSVSGLVVYDAPEWFTAGDAANAVADVVAYLRPTGDWGLGCVTFYANHPLYEGKNRTPEKTELSGTSIDLSYQHGRPAEFAHEYFADCVRHGIGHQILNSMGVGVPAQHDAMRKAGFPWL